MQEKSSDKNCKMATKPLNKPRVRNEIENHTLEATGYFAAGLTLSVKEKGRILESHLILLRVTKTLRSRSERETASFPPWASNVRKREKSRLRKGARFQPTRAARRNYDSSFFPPPVRYVRCNPEKGRRC
jgi:hypothetical protein